MAHIASVFKFVCDHKDDLLAMLMLCLALACKQREETCVLGTRGARDGKVLRICRYTDWMKRLQEVVLPLMLSVEKQLPQVSGISLDADRNPPFVTDADQNAHDPMLQQIPLHHLSDDSNMPDALRSAVQRVRHNGQHRIEGADVLCTVCDAAVQDALGNGTLLPSKVLYLH